jgi:CheY-like chemotaxis protein
MIICVDPDATSRAATTEVLDAAGFDTRGCDSARVAREILADDPSVNCLVAEYDLPDGTGLDVLNAARAESPDAACILFTATPLDDVDTAAFGDVVAEYLSKDDPNAREELVALVEHSLAFRSQTSYPLPDDEEARLAALGRYATDEAALESALDRLTELAAELFDVDSATVGLVDAHHERFLSCHGVSMETLAREDTVCTYAILDDDVMIVEDIGEDPRFADNEILQDSPICFYAGAPVTMDGRFSDGERLLWYRTVAIHRRRRRS